jgi:hypothetical protein
VQVGERHDCKGRGAWWPSKRMPHAVQACVDGGLCEAAACRDLYAEFLCELLAASRLYADELLAVCLELLLSAPPCMLEPQVPLSWAPH